MKDKVCIITGASSGIGKSIVYELSKFGAKLVIAARNYDELVLIQKDLTSKSIDVLAVKTDVTSESDCNSLINKTIARYGKIDVLINNAGIAMRAMFEDIELDVVKRVMDVNFWGTVYCTKYALPHILSVKGSIVGVISIAGFVGLPARTAYSASKFAIRGFLETLRIENIKKGLHVLIAAPGFTASNVRKNSLNSKGNTQNDSPRDENKMMSSERCAEIIVKGIKKRKRTIIMTFIEGKFTVFLSKIFPKLLDKLAYNHMAKEPNTPLK